MIIEIPQPVQILSVSGRINLLWGNFRIVLNTLLKLKKQNKTDAHGYVSVCFIFKSVSVNVCRVVMSVVARSHSFKKQLDYSFCAFTVKGPHEVLYQQNICRSSPAQCFNVLFCKGIHFGVKLYVMLCSQFAK